MWTNGAFCWHAAKLDTLWNDTWLSEGVWKVKNLTMFLLKWSLKSKLGYKWITIPKTWMSLKKGNLNVLQKGHLECPPKRSALVSLKNVNLNVPQKGQLKCPSKRATWMSLKKGNLNVPLKGQLECPPKRSTWMSLKKVSFGVPQKGQLECPSKRSTWISFRTVKFDGIEIKLNMKRLTDKWSTYITKYKLLRTVTTKLEFRGTLGSLWNFTPRFWVGDVDVNGKSSRLKSPKLSNPVLHNL